MPTTLITLPCTARQLESALHAACDHDGLWSAEISEKNVFVRVSDVPCVALMRRTQLVLCDDAKTTDDTKGEAK